MKLTAFGRRLDFRNQISQPLSGGRIANHVASDRSIGNSRRRLASSQPDGNDESLTRSGLIRQKKFAIIARVTVGDPIWFLCVVSASSAPSAVSLSVQ